MKSMRGINLWSYFGNQFFGFVGLSFLIACSICCGGSEDETKLSVSPLQVSTLLKKNVVSQTDWLERGFQDMFGNDTITELIEGIDDRFAKGCRGSDVVGNPDEDISFPPLEDDASGFPRPVDIAVTFPDENGDISGEEGTGPFSNENEDISGEEGTGPFLNENGDILDEEGIGLFSSENGDISDEEDIGPLPSENGDLSDEEDFGLVTDEDTRPSLFDDSESFWKMYREYLTKNLSEDLGTLDSEGTSVYYDLDPTRVCGEQRSCRQLLSSEPFFLRVIRPADIEVEGVDNTAQEALKIYLHHGSRENAEEIGSVLLAGGQIFVEFNIGIWGELVKDVAKRNFELSDKVIDRLNATQMKGTYRLKLSGSDNGDINIAVSSSNILFGTKDYAFSSGEVRSNLQFKHGSLDPKAGKDKVRNSFSANINSKGLTVGLKLKSLCDRADEAGFSSVSIAECRDAKEDDDIVTFSGIDMGFLLNIAKDEFSVSNVRIGKLLSLKVLKKNLLSIWGRKEPSDGSVQAENILKGVNINAKLVNERIGGHQSSYVHLTADSGFGFEVNVNALELPATVTEEFQELTDGVKEFFQFFFTAEQGTEKGIDISIPIACDTTEDQAVLPFIFREGGVYLQNHQNETDDMPAVEIFATGGPVCTTRLDESIDGTSSQNCQDLGVEDAWSLESRD